MGQGEHNVTSNPPDQLRNLRDRSRVVGNKKGRMGLGIALGILPGVIGLIIIACIPAKKYAQSRGQRNQMPPATHPSTGC